MSKPRLIFPKLALIVLATLSASLRAQVAGTAIVSNAPSIGGTVLGSIQVLSAQSFAINSGAAISGDILLPGTPTVTLNGSPTYSGTTVGTGSASPSGYTITLNSGSSLRNVVTRSNPVAIPSVAAPPAPTGTRSVTINNSTDSVGSYSTLKSLTLNSGVGQFAVPAGTYGSFSANSGSGFTLGVAGATVPSVYNFQQLTLNSSSQIVLLGPVTILRYRQNTGYIESRLHIRVRYTNDSVRFYEQEICRRTVQSIARF